MNLFFSYFLMVAIDKKLREYFFLFFFRQWDTALLFWREVFIFLKN